ncbi:MAG: acylphosphatase [Hyphomicrobium sp.]
MAVAEKTVRVSVEGRVQGVGYRSWVERTAVRIGVAGWVRNRRDGTVEAVFSGEAAAVEEMIERCAYGPRSAVVSRVSTADATGSFQGFDIRPTE